MPLFEAAPVEPGGWPHVIALDGRCSAVFAAERTVLHAAHCGVQFASAVFGDDVRTPRFSIPVEACETQPNAELGNGLDIGFCRLAESPPLPPVRVLGQAAATQLVPGTPAMRIGFGPASENDSFGVKRSQPGVILEAADEIVVGGPSGSCSGDSGGPLFVALGEPGSTVPEPWLLAGILSAGESLGCEPGVDHYSPVRGAIDWLESESGIRLETGLSDSAVGPAGTRPAVREPSPAASCSLPHGGADSGWLPAWLTALALSSRRRHRLTRRYAAELRSRSAV